MNDGHRPNDRRITTSVPDILSLRLSSSSLDLSQVERKGGAEKQVELVDRWEGRNHRKLSEDGYKTLAIIATFLASTQAQVLSSTLAGDGIAYHVINAFFIAGLLADLFSAVISFSSARWFEMLTQDEEDHLHKCWQNAERQQKLSVNNCSFVDRWVAMSVVMGPFAVILGMAFFIFGIMIFVWAYQPLVVKVTSTIVCGSLSLPLESDTTGYMP